MSRIEQAVSGDSVRVAEVADTYPEPVDDEHDALDYVWG